MTEFKTDFKLKPEMTKNEARVVILQAVNNARLAFVRKTKHLYQLPLFGSRQIQQAVYYARRNKLVSPEVFKAAKYNGMG